MWVMYCINKETVLMEIAYSYSIYQNNYVQNSLWKQNWIKIQEFWLHIYYSFMSIANLSLSDTAGSLHL